MTVPHGSRFGFPGTISALFKSTDDPTLSIEGNEAPAEEPPYGQVTISHSGGASRVQKEADDNRPDQGSGQNAAFCLSPQGTTISGPEPRSGDVPEDIDSGSPSLLHDVAVSHTVAMGEDDSERPVVNQRRKCGKRLTRDQRRDILLMRRLGHKYEDIAKFLGVTQAAVQYTVNRGRASPEHHKAGRRKLERPDVPRHANGRKIRSDVGSSKRPLAESNGRERTEHGSRTPSETQSVSGDAYPELPQVPNSALHPTLG